MTLADLGNLGEFIGAIAVVATLIYLAFQVRQNTRSVRASTYENVVSASALMNSMIVQDEAVAQIWRVGARDVSALTPQQRVRHQFLIGQWLNMYENIFLQWEQGTVDDDYFDGRMALLRSWLELPGIREVWGAQKFWRSKRFVRYVVENVIDQRS